jgi:chromosome segregation ATPase
MASPSPLTLEGLAEIVRGHAEDTAARFRDVENQIHSVTGQVETLVGLIREQGLRITSLAERQEEPQRQIWQILHRLDQHDARFEVHDQRFEEILRRLDQHDIYIRRMLDLLERRGGDGGPERP